MDLKGASDFLGFNYNNQNSHLRMDLTACQTE